MAVNYVDPDQDVAVNCRRAGGSSNYSNIDNGVREPSDPGTADYIYVIDTDGELEDVYGTTDPVADIVDLSDVTVWAYSAGSSAADLLNVSVSGNAGVDWEADQELFEGDDSEQWRSYAFTSLGYNNIEIDASFRMRVKLYAEDDMAYVYALYGYITYTQPAYTPPAGSTITFLEIGGILVPLLVFLMSKKRGLFIYGRKGVYLPINGKKIIVPRHYL